MAWKVPSNPGDIDPSIAEAKGKLRKYLYGKSLDSTSIYTVEFGVALVQFQINRNEQISKGRVVGKPGMAVDGALDWRVKKNLEIYPYDKTQQNAKPVPVVITVQGHMGGMFDGPQYFAARALEDPVRRIDVQPAYYDNTRKPFNNKSGILALDRIANDPNEIPFGVPWAVSAHSQGSVVFCDWWEQICQPNLNRWPYSHFRGGINFGNPRRPRNVVVPWISDPPPRGSEGLDPDCLEAAIPGVIEVARDGDLYANKTPGDAADYKEAVYTAVCRGRFFGSDSLGAELSELARKFGNPMEIFALFKAITSGVSGLITLREHGEFDLRPCVDHLARILEV